MPDELLTVFKLCFLALLYLFFFRVLRAVWTEVNASSAPAATPGPTPPATPSGGPVPVAPAAPATSARRSKRSSRRGTGPAEGTATPVRLVAVEPPNMVGIEYALADGMSIGRSEASAIAIDDSFLSGRHAAFSLRDGAWVVEDLGSTNGTYLNRNRVERLARLTMGDRVQLGNVVLEVR